MTNEEAKKVIETLLFVSESPLSLKRISEILEGFDSNAIKVLIEELKTEYSQTNRTFTIEEVGGGSRFATDPFYGPWIKKLYKDERKARLSMPSLETLSVIAYKQPVTKAEIEAIRGVSVDGVIKNLLDRNIIKINGRKEIPGRPFLYSTTQEFLIHFGLNSLEGLPRLKEFSEGDIELGKKQLIEKEQEISDETDQLTQKD